MHKSVCVKNPDAITLRDCFGATVLSTVNGLCTVFMSSMFMQYMTDYAGLGAMGATLATSLLLFARIFDAVDDPIQGFLMDRGKRTKIGKYKPFFSPQHTADRHWLCMSLLVPVRVGVQARTGCCVGYRFLLFV